MNAHSSLLPTRAAAAAAPTATITLTRFAEPNWLVQETLESLARQSGLTATVLFLDQQDDAQLRAFALALSNDRVRFIYERIPAKSLSFARNYAIKTAADDIILYIDSDAIAESDWAASLTRSLLRDRVAVAGGRILPKWHRPPLLLAKARLVQDQYSLLDLGQKEQPFHRIVGASFGIRRDRLGMEAYFDESLGRRKGLLLGGEESDLCRRAADAGWSVLYSGRAVVRHQILPERICYGWILKRFYYGGISRALVGGRPGMPRRRTLWDYLALPFVLPSYALGYVQGRRLAPQRRSACL